MAFLQCIVNVCRNKFKTNFFSCQNFTSQYYIKRIHKVFWSPLDSRISTTARYNHTHTSTLKMQIGLGGHYLVVHTYIHVLNQLINHWETTIYLNIHYKVQTEEDSALDPQVTKSLQYLCMYFSSALACLLIGMYLGKNENNYQYLVNKYDNMKLETQNLPFACLLCRYAESSKNVL